MAPPHPRSLNATEMTFWLLFLSTGIERNGGCRTSCAGSSCVTVHKATVDFHSADETCRRSNGELLSLAWDDDISRALDYGNHGNFWIGLSLPDGTCSDLSAPLRGYKWSGNGRNSNLTFSFWKDSVAVCSPRCVSTSRDREWTERSCREEIDGFLCRTDREHACQTQQLTGYFRSARGCADGPCEHDCTEVNDGYRCSCREGYSPDSDDPRKCELHCAGEKCPPVCDAIDTSVCSCPRGYIMNEHTCEDIDECEMLECEQSCKNTYGSFRCSCYKGFVLRDQVKCKPTTEGNGYLDFTTAIVPAFVHPATKNTTLQGSSLSTGEFIWLWICVAVMVIVLVCVVRWYALKRQKRAQRNLTQQMTLSQRIDIQ